MRLSDLEGRRVALWGLGREGRATLAALCQLFPEQPFTVVDEAALAPELEEEIAKAGNVRVTADAAEIARHDVVVKSPGISLYRPEAVAARRRGVTITSATRLWFADHNGERTVCVTGTKGKSTTASLLDHLLREAGEDVELRGNIGRPLLAPCRREPGVWVVELSSYQTADLTSDPNVTVDPTVAVLLNLYPEHLDWHGDVETYYRDKTRLFVHQRDGRAVVNRADPETRRFAEVFRRPVYFNDAEGFHLDGRAVRRGERTVIDRQAIALRGRHNHENVCAALAAVECLGLDAEAVAPALATFRGLPHRLHPLGERDGVLWVDDSISTTPQSAMAAIEAYAGRPVTVLLGGYDRGIAYGELARFLVARGVEVAVTLPGAGRRIAAELLALGAARPELYEAEDLDEAVAVARRRTPRGGVVLLSPAAPSYGAFRDFEERGEAFARASMTLRD